MEKGGAQESRRRGGWEEGEGDIKEGREGGLLHVLRRGTPLGGLFLEGPACLADTFPISESAPWPFQTRSILCLVFQPSGTDYLGRKKSNITTYYTSPELIRDRPHII